VNPNTIPAVANRPKDLIYGLIDTQIKVNTPGDAATVIVYLPEPAPEGYKWYKYGPNMGWYDYSEHAVFNANRDQVSLALIDGGIGDDDGIKNGIIIDPSGLGSSPQDENGSAPEIFGNDHFKWRYENGGYILMFSKGDVGTPVGAPYMGGSWNNWQYNIPLVSSPYYDGWLETLDALYLSGEKYFTFVYQEGTDTLPHYAWYSRFSVNNEFAVTRIDENGKAAYSYGANFTENGLSPISAAPVFITAETSTDSSGDTSSSTDGAQTNSGDSTKDDGDRPKTKFPHCFITSLKLSDFL